MNALDSSDPESRPEPNRPIGAPERRDAPVFLVASDSAYLEEIRRDSPTLPAGSTRFTDITDLDEAVSQLERLPLAFALIVERDGRDVDIHALRQLRLSADPRQRLHRWRAHPPSPARPHQCGSYRPLPPGRR